MARARKIGTIALTGLAGAAVVGGLIYSNAETERIDREAAAETAKLDKNLVEHPKYWGRANVVAGYNFSADEINAVNRAAEKLRVHPHRLMLAMESKNELFFKKPAVEGALKTLAEEQRSRLDQVRGKVRGLKGSFDRLRGEDSFRTYVEEPYRKKTSQPAPLPKPVEMKRQKALPYAPSRRR